MSNRFGIIGFAGDPGCLLNASTVSGTYGPAYRLVNIADSPGNSIAYTLDSIGN